MHNRIDENINFIKSNNCNVLILRHSIREPIIDARNSQKQLLTKEGEELSKYFGINLPDNKKYKLFFSPVKRCEQTAEFIQKGLLEKNNEISSFEQNVFLTGFYVKNSEVMSQVNQMSSFKFIENWFNNKFHENLLQSFLTSRQQMLKSVLSQSTLKDDTINIHITHDWNIMLMYSYLFEINNEEYVWPDFLQGVYISQKDGADFISNGLKTKKILYVA